MRTPRRLAITHSPSWRWSRPHLRTALKLQDRDEVVLDLMPWLAFAAASVLEHLTGPIAATRIRRVGKVLAGAVVVLVVLGVLTAVRAMQRDACFTGGGASDGYNGLTVAEAEERSASRGYNLRVVGRDGECFAGTSDFRDDRVNVYVEGSEVARSRNY